MIHEIIEPAVAALAGIGPLAGQLSAAACLVMADLDGYPTFKNTISRLSV
jgi:hypothetical protein